MATTVFNLWSLLVLVFIVPQIKCAPPVEYYHDVERYRPAPDPWVNGSKIPESYESPDYRQLETPWRAFDASYPYLEQERPYRISPHYKQAYKWNRVHKWFIESGSPEQPFLLGCYCTTVYRRLTPLAGCAVLTPRHILTTASSTELVIKHRHDDKTLVNVLGAWYDIDENVFNSSMYMTPARIHYHPRYFREHMVNISHPLPMMYDLSVWAATHNFYSTVCTCQRANSGYFYYGSTAPQYSDLAIVVGFQYVKALRKKPIPFTKYAVRTKKFLYSCPKSEWGWYHCISATLWAKYGVESGAAWHRATLGVSWLRDGLAALNAFSLMLRSENLVHYFTPINTHPVLNFIFDAYMGLLPYEYLDQRFHNNKWRAPVGKSWYYIPWDEHYYGANPGYDYDTDIKINK